MWSLSAGVPLADRYLLIEKLGTGGMSVVWRGYDDVLDRPVAVKVLASPIAADPAFRESIAREARAAARLTHPHITQVYDYGEATLPDGHAVPYVVMELLDGQTLTQRLAAGPLPWPEAVRMVAQVADALAAAHRRGTVHRDIAPANIVLTATGAKVVDFGISALAGGQVDPDGGSPLGTPAYVAPERLEDAPAAPAADVYGLGAVLYEALTGAPPLPVRTWDALTEAVAAGTAVPPPRVAGLPRTVADLAGRCLHRDPARRPGAAEVSRTLAGVLATDPAPVPPAGGGERPGAPTTEATVRRRRHGRTLAAGGLLVLAITVTTLVLTTSGGPDRTPPVAGSPPGSLRPGPTAVPTTRARTSPPPVPVATGPVPTPTAASATPTAAIRRDTTVADQVSPADLVSDLLQEVDQERQAGHIRPDAATDLDNELHNLRHALLAGDQVDLVSAAGRLRHKISDRVGDGAITYPCARRLLSLVDSLADT